MSAQLLDGKALANSLKQSIPSEVRLLSAIDTPVTLASLMIGDDAGARAYINSQKKTAEQLKVRYTLYEIPAKASQNEAIEYIRRLNQDPNTHGIIIQQPVPAQIDYEVLISHIEAPKDVEGMNAANLGKLILGKAKIIPCTAAAVMELIKSTGVSLRGKEAVVVGRSEIVGKPVSLLLLKESATVTVCHSGTSDAGKLEDHIARADIVVVAVGKPEFVKGKWIKKGAIVIDVGINKVGDKIVGDVEFEEARKRAAFITPVPGGVGPLTVVMLLRNCMEAWSFYPGKHKKK